MIMVDSLLAVYFIKVLTLMWPFVGFLVHGLA